MTTPHGSGTDGAFVLGSQYGQDITESSARAVMKAGSVGASGSYTNVQGAVNTQVKTPIVATQAVAVTTGIIGGQTVTRYLYLSGGTWTKPAPPTGKRISRIGACAICGGNGGDGPPGGNGDGAEGGEGGGYLYKEFVNSLVPNSVSIAIGAGGLGGGVGARGSIGGTSSFGTLVVGVPATSNVQTSQGALGATNAPGRGGRGGGGGGGSGDNPYFYKSPGLRGQSTALGVGGNGGAPLASGSPGGATATDPHIFSGGAGGGGGGGSDAGSGAFASLRPGGGGAGAAPGGGGGGAGGGQRGGVPAPAWLPGGAGGNGGVCVWVYFEDITTT